jgi:hypothetical protein
VSGDDKTILNRAWNARAALYNQLFGDHMFSLPKTYAPPKVEIQEVKSAADIAAILGTNISERDVSIVVYPPTESTPYWLYVTSGLSNPWFGEGDGEVSGFGHELVLKTKEPGRWQFRLLRRLASYVLTYSGTLQPGVMLQFDMPLFYSDRSAMDGILIWYLDEAVECIYDLPSGKFGIFLVLGIMSDEADFVRSFSDGCWCMQQLLRNAGHDQITDPFRESIMDTPEVKEKLHSLRSYAQLFATTEEAPPTTFESTND